MQKIREILPLLFFLWTSQDCIGQDTCIIKYHTGFSGEVILLLDSNKFEFNSYSCIHNNEEKGIYYFDNQKLILSFIDTSESQLVSRISEMKSLDNTGDKVNIKFKIISDIDNRPLEFATVRILVNDRKIVNMTDENGETNLTFEKAHKELRVVVSYVGHQTLDLPLEFENKNYSITINLSKKRTKIHRNEEEVIYYISRKGKGYIELSKNGKEFVQYEYTCH